MGEGAGYLGWGGAGEFRPLPLLAFRSVLLLFTLAVAPKRFAAPVTRSRMRPLYISASALWASRWDRWWVRSDEAWRVSISISRDMSRSAGRVSRVSWSGNGGISECQSAPNRLTFAFALTLGKAYQLLRSCQVQLRHLRLSPVRRAIPLPGRLPIRLLAWLLVQLERERGQCLCSRSIGQPHFVKIDWNAKRNQVMPSSA